MATTKSQSLLASTTTTLWVASTLGDALTSPGTFLAIIDFVTCGEFHTCVVTMFGKQYNRVMALMLITSN